MIIDRTYFWGSRRLPFKSTATGTAARLATAQGVELDQYIAMYEDEMLTLLFGDLKDAYVAGRETMPWSAVDALMVNSTTKDSLLADYTFFHLWNDASTSVDDSGTFVSTRDSGTVVANAERTIPVWNAMIDKIILVMEYLSEHHDELVGELEFNYDGWTRFVTVDGRNWLGNYINEFGL